jgi:hypothetical protein
MKIVQILLDNKLAAGNSKNWQSKFDYHINYYLTGLLSAFENGKPEISGKYSFDLPQIKSETDWNKNHLRIS